MIDSPGSDHGNRRIFWASIFASVVALQLGAFCVVLQTWLSGVSALPLGSFMLAMQPVHLAIGFVEGLVTAAVIVYVRQLQPSLVSDYDRASKTCANVSRRFAIGMLAVTFLVAGIVSWFASSKPDGLEWAVAGVSGQEELAAPGTGIYETAAQIQQATAILPDYGFATTEEEAPAEENRLKANAGTTFAGLAGAGMLLALALVVGWIMRPAKQPQDASCPR